MPVMFDWDIFELGGKKNWITKPDQTNRIQGPHGSNDTTLCLDQVFPCASNFSPVRSPLCSKDT